MRQSWDKTCKLEKFSVERSCWFSLPLALDVEELLDVYGPNKATTCCRGSLGSPGQDWPGLDDMGVRVVSPAFVLPGTRGSCRSGTSSAEVACHGNGRGGVILWEGHDMGGIGPGLFLVEVRRWKKNKIEVAVLSRWRESCQLQLGNTCNII